MKKVIIFVMMVLMSVGVVSAVNIDDCGTGPTGLFGSWDCSADAELVNDIDCSGYPVRTAPTCGELYADFDGNNYTISNLEISCSSSFSCGIFAEIGDVSGSPIGYVKNLGLINISVDGDTWGNVGVLAGILRYASIVDNVYVRKSKVLTGSASGGLIGWSTGGQINNVYLADNEISGNSFSEFTGGIVGRQEGSVTNSYSSCNIVEASLKGGIVGNGGVTDSYSDGTNEDSIGNILNPSGSGPIGGCSLAGETDCGGPGMDIKTASLAGLGSWDTNVWSKNPAGFPILSSLAGEDQNDICGEIVEETCSDAIQNQDETGIDCGGVCDACETCSDAIQNQDETGIDCGGVCDACVVDSDGDGVGDDVDNCPTEYNPDQSNLDSQDGGDVCDQCPEDATDLCDSYPTYTEGTNVDENGGTVENVAGEAIIDIPVGALPDDTSVSMSRGGSNFEVNLPPARGGTALLLYSYTLSSGDVETFNEFVTLTFSYAGIVDDNQAQRLEILRLNDLTGEWESLGGSVDTEADTISVIVSHFSDYAVGYELLGGNGGAEIPEFSTVGIIIVSLAAIGMMVVIRKKKQ